MTAWGLYISVSLGYGGIIGLMWLSGAPVFMTITFAIAMLAVLVSCWWDIDGWTWWYNRKLKKTLANLERG